MSLKIENLGVRFSKAVVLSNVNIKVEEGRPCMIIGPNGAGKTTLLSTISGIIKPFTGRIIFRGKHLEKLQPHEIAKEGIIHAPERGIAVPYLTVMDNLMLGAYLRKDKKEIKKDLKKILDLFPPLNERKEKPASTLSGGELKMLGIARALLAKPTLLLLDEPLMGLAPIIKKQIIHKIREVVETQNLTVLMTEQEVALALNIPSMVYVLEAGRIVLQGESREIIKEEILKKIYLGD